ncbi:hypothetical protein [Actinoplanes sp. NPDC020271]|uniref:hypothetical protein n=1 Tax=Actinoplanes sp. NPDC020271 TaxID=3363896 RepID=UPI0037965FAB
MNAPPRRRWTTVVAVAGVSTADAGIGVWAARTDPSPGTRTGPAAATRTYSVAGTGWVVSTVAPGARGERRIVFAVDATAVASSFHLTLVPGGADTGGDLPLTA